MKWYTIVIVLIGVVCAAGYLVLNAQDSDTESNATEINTTITVNNSNLTVAEFKEKYNIPDNYSYPVTGDRIKVVD